RGEPRARAAGAAPAAPSARRSIGPAAVRVANRHRSAALRRGLEPPGGDPRVLYAIPAERLSRGLGVHRRPGEHQVPPQAGAVVTAALWLAASYLIGAIPTSYVAGRVGRGIDLREHGSRNLGATNVYRVLGWRYAIPVGLFDVVKGALPVTLCERWSGGPPWLPVAAGVAAVTGHVFSPYVRFKGGKGVATA